MTSQDSQILNLRSAGKSEKLLYIVMFCSLIFLVGF